MAPSSKLLQASVAREKTVVPRTIDFVPASSSALKKAEDPDGNDGPVPTHYLYPREKLANLFNPPPPRSVGRGLKNVGNTCFFNSVIQVLVHTVPLQNYLLSNEHASSCKVQSNGGFCALCILARHVQTALESNRSPVHPKQMLQRIKEFGGRNMRLGRQEDAHEFLMHCLDACHRSLLQTQNVAALPLPVQHTTFIRQLFGGYFRSRIVCLECQRESNTYDPFLDISLEVHNCTSLDRALDGFTKMEKLCGKNRYRCKRCQRLVDATKQFSIHAVPPMLAFQLKRFDFTMQSRAKIVKPISFGTSLNISRFTSHPEQEALYRLSAVVVHAGSSARSGHYFSFVRHAGTWHRCDDESVSIVSESVVLRQQAYLLFYQTAAPSRQKLESSVNGHVEANGKHAITNGVKRPLEVRSRLLDASACHMQANGSNGSKAVNGVAHSASATPLEAGPTSAVQKSNGAAQKFLAESKKSVTAAHGSLNSGVSDVLPANGVSPSTAQAPEVSGAVRASEEQHRKSGSRRKASKMSRVRRLRALSSWQRRRREKAALAVDTEPREPAKKRLRSGASDSSEPEGVHPAAPTTRGERQCGGERVFLAGSYETQFGLASVATWEDTGVDRSAFAEAQRALQPPPSTRDRIDKDYDTGKRKHKPKKAKRFFSGTVAFDKELQVRQGCGRTTPGKGRGRGR